MPPRTFRRLGLMGGSGGADPWPARFGIEPLLDPKMLAARERDALRDRLPDCSGRSTVGTREVVDTKVGSEMSRFFTDRFMDSSKRVVFDSLDGTLGAEGRRGEGRGPVGVDTTELAYGEGRPLMGEMGDG